jgi:hypothetical protein
MYYFIILIIITIQLMMSDAQWNSKLCRVIFVSSRTVNDGTLGASPSVSPIFHVDSLCSTLAGLSSLGVQKSVWRAFISTSSQSAVEHVALESDDCFIDSKGRSIANSTADLFSGRRWIEFDENQRSRAADHVWTGTRSNGASAAANCDEWKVGNVSATGSRGYVSDPSTSMHNWWLFKDSVVRADVVLSAASAVFSD